MTPHEHLEGSDLGVAVFDAVEEALAGFDDVDVRTTKSQIAFRRKRGFAYLWLPGTYLTSPQAEVVLSIALDREVDSPRFKEVAHPSKGIWQHHLEITDVDDLDDEVLSWLHEAREAAG